MFNDDADTLRFLGRMNAHISHELKNILATISETAGLMEDLIEIGTLRGELNTKRIEELCNRITTLTTRGNATVRDMNRLAHSMDEPVRDSDAGEEVSLMASISQYAPYSRPVDLSSSGDDLPLRARSLHLQHLLSELFAAAFTTLERDQKLPAALEPEADGAKLTLELMGKLPADNEAFSEAMALAGKLGAKVELKGKTLSLTLRNAPEENALP